jgi:hypothetical protein
MAENNLHIDNRCRKSDDNLVDHFIAAAAKPAFMPQSLDPIYWNPAHPMRPKALVSEGMFVGEKSSRYGIPGPRAAGQAPNPEESPRTAARQGGRSGGANAAHPVAVLVAPWARPI